MQGERIERQNPRTISIGKYMEIKTTYRQGLKEAILDTQKYKQRHYHDYSVISTDIDVNEEYAAQMIIDIYAQATTSEPIHTLHDAAPRDEDYKDHARCRITRITNQHGI
eukprot:4861108-Amphidinium_carterae.4